MSSYVSRSPKLPANFIVPMMKGHYNSPLFPDDPQNTIEDDRAQCLPPCIVPLYLKWQI